MEPWVRCDSNLTRYASSYDRVVTLAILVSSYTFVLRYSTEMAIGSVHLARSDLMHLTYFYSVSAMSSTRTIVVEPMCQHPSSITSLSAIFKPLIQIVSSKINLANHPSLVLLSPK